MTGKEHANLIGIFSYVFAGIQGLMTLFFVVYTLVMAAVVVMSLTQNERSDPGGTAVVLVIMAIMGVVSLLGLTSIYLNVKNGRRSRSGTPPPERSVKVTALLNICSLFYGGMVSMPFGAALGAYELWFATSDAGKRYLAGQPEPQPQFINPPPAQVYTEPSAYQNEPYKWR